MSLMPSPVLIIGDAKLGKDTVVKAKKKYKDHYWQTVSANKMTCDEIRMHAGLHQFGYTKKVILITEIPNRKQVRAFIVDLVKTSPESFRFVIFDSEGIIKIDPKKKKISKTWQDWIDELKQIEGCVVINNGGDFAENDIKSPVSYVQGLFQKYKRTIDNNTAKIFVDMVGKNRAMLSSEVEKLCLVAPTAVTRDFVLERTFPSSKEAVLYKLGNDLDKDYATAITSLEHYLSMGINGNVIAQILATKARWHLAICDLYSKGYSWDQVRYQILDMGKFPSCVWHNDQLPESQKKKLSIDLNDPDNLKEFMVRKMGIPEDYLNIKVPKTISKAVKKGEHIFMPFIGDMMLAYAKSVVVQNKGKYGQQEIKDKMLTRAVNVYLICTDNLKEIRFNHKTQVESLHKMVKAWANKTA